jgi:hypothetical protein
MAARIIRLLVEDAPALGFDTGLSAAAFAQAKLAQLLSQSGSIAGPGGIEAWKPEGVVEREGTMVIWGPPFRGERLDRLLSGEAQPDRALTALRYWIKARLTLGAAAPHPWPAGAFIALPDYTEDAPDGPGGPGEPDRAPDEPGGSGEPDGAPDEPGGPDKPGGSGGFPPGTVFFPPERLLRRAVEAEGPGAWLEGAERWVHPDLSGDEAAVFAAGAMLYRIFCGAPPFPRQDPDTLRQDMREGIFLPPRLASPALKEEAASLIERAIRPAGQKGGASASRKQTPPPGMEALQNLLDPPDSPERAAPVRADFFQTLDGETLEKIRLEGERFRKKQGDRVKAKRFLRRNTAIIGGIVIGLVILGAIIQNILSARAQRPSTQGMTPLEVVETYYGAFGDLDHLLMEACVIDGAGKSDIDIVLNLFVISRVREAYEQVNPVIPAQEWLDSGAGPAEGMVFGVSGLRIEPGDRDGEDGELSFSAAYTRWTPGSAESSGPGADAGGALPGPILPLGEKLRDELRLVRRKEAWRIAGISRYPQDGASSAE